ncbi:[FeFe] hydrogenase H-cluster radical SAM maturase HydE [uncultured Clostridium sp.]|uniref:[FeFe] hydrogenase H-cluster radical SAM maturase HydE n=1 Tax=uncultured Clostridium sp. TaxID=59620 RepID=UPI0025D4E310|nr:[FeFe] hydrogenase H-cluster radical SAM maturase HydE [uncultured Clostridium sp.]
MRSGVREEIKKLYKYNNLSKDELISLLYEMKDEDKEILVEAADRTRKERYGNKVYIRGLIEFTNYCKKKCRYCGIRASNKNLERYRLTKEEIIKCIKTGKELGYSTYVLQGGEDPYFNDEKMIEIIRAIKTIYPNDSITLSIGERSYESYKKMYEAGADRYLLRHETASRRLYEKLHPDGDYDNRIKCLWNLKEIGYQIGAGFMIGLPGQTKEDLVEDLLFLKELRPHMCGIGPFIPHKDTPFKLEKQGELKDVITMLAIIRLLLPDVLLPATTALGTISNKGREMGIKAGANVVMPNLSPISVRDKYSLYNNKICTGDEAAECRCCIEKRINSIGFEIDLGRGDSLNWIRR